MNKTYVTIIYRYRMQYITYNKLSAVRSIS